MPKLRKAIQGVGAASIVELKARLYRTREESRLPKNSSTINTVRARKRPAGGLLSQKNSQKNSRDGSRGHKKLHEGGKPDKSEDINFENEAARTGSNSERETETCLPKKQLDELLSSKQAMSLTQVCQLVDGTGPMNGI